MEKNKEELYSLMKEFKRKKYGRIAKVYTPEEEKAIYEATAKIIDLKYCHLISKEEIVEVLSKKGKIFSVDFGEAETFGICEKGSCNIGVNEIIRNISATLLHELIHRKYKQ